MTVGAMALLGAVPPVDRTTAGVALAARVAVRTVPRVSVVMIVVVIRGIVIPVMIVVVLRREIVPVVRTAVAVMIVVVLRRATAVDVPTVIMTAVMIVAVVAPSVNMHSVAVRTAMSGICVRSAPVSARNA
ncbi:hypothetical protein COCCU_06750 [Corynebacterium occultum]|uniref:Uncharacterized protein n=1 Tax=Corynebacterium occultum TaxID=2675219 RepID=A0A6B8W7L1_9CORY|nr:hypothetical protein COCCU_06750 [Corynebacterium occultum]